MYTLLFCICILKSKSFVYFLLHTLHFFQHKNKKEEKKKFPFTFFTKKEKKGFVDFYRYSIESRYYTNNVEISLSQNIHLLDR